eukprot:3621151-Prorocentrum_lima.AAC.1
MGTGSALDISPPRPRFWRHPLAGCCCSGCLHGVFAAALANSTSSFECGAWCCYGGGVPSTAWLIQAVEGTPPP